MKTVRNRRQKASGRRLRRWLVFVLLVPLTWGIAGCGAKYLTTPITAPGPKIISADEREITIETKGWTLPDEQARQHCEKYGKTSRYLSAIRSRGKYQDNRLHFCKCI